MLHQYDLVERIKLYDPHLNEEALTKAYVFAMNAHGAQTRASGDPYFSHPIEVATILADMRLDTSTIITALLHDTVEDTTVTLEDIEREFGKEIAQLVDGVTKLTKIEFQPDHVRQAENFRKLFIAMSEDIRVLLVKLADRLHNMRTLHHVRSPEKRKRIAHETMEIYTPLAERFGIQHMKNELQELAFSELYPEVRLSLNNRLEFLRKQGNVVVERIIQEIQRTLEGAGINAKVYGREKHPCSIWRKMQRKNISFEQLTDIVAFRVIVDSVQDCYRVLGAIHSKYHMVPDSFKDFISTPKGNGYQSLHTVVMGPERQAIEIQIRTQDMHQIAEYGVAAHWSYKQGENTYTTDGKQYRWVRELLTMLENASDPQEFLEHTKLEMYYDQVFCFTPRGDLIALPKGATPVDFAYAVHSDVGNSCVGAKVNGSIVPLRTPLDNGDQVDIIRSKTQIPSPTWEKFVVTGKAKTEIRRFIRNQKRTEYVNLGRAILAKALRGHGEELHDATLEPVLKGSPHKTIDDVYAAVGEGTLSREEVVRLLFPEQKTAKPRRNPFSILRFKPKDPDKKEAISINGLIPGMALHFAGCCHPLPGDRIVGILNSGKGVTIHTLDCEMLESFADTPERWVDVSWERENNTESYTGRLKATLSHEAGSLATLANTISKDMGNISNLKILTRSNDFFEILVDVEVRGAAHMNTIISTLRAQPCIHSVERYKL